MVSHYRSYPRALEYLKDTWLTAHKERFIAAWTNKVKHFGNVTTNRAESAHAKLKRHLGSSQGDFDSSWKVINSLIELQHTEIKASFESNVTVVEHNFRPVLFRELRGLVFRTALNILLKQAHRANDPGIDHLICGCIIRSTHGLPCAHEIAEFMRDRKPIPLSVLDPHWSKLDLKRKIVDYLAELNLDAEWELIVKRFNACDLSRRLALKKKLRELGDLVTTFLIPPLEKAKIKGRSDKSTRRAPSYFEIVESQHDSTSTPTNLNSATKRMKLPVNRKKKVKFIDSFPLEIRPFIHSTLDVESDGHCGFQAIAGLLGMSVDAWAKVRQDLIEEICDFRAYYVSLYGSMERVDELLETL